jgi:CRISPR/Cas system endoribonuclease Cas6 (RAMP superfamily)
VETEESTLQWFDWKRYSNRQEMEMLMGGLVGGISYTGALTEFCPLLRLGEVVHVGKQTTFGLGKIEVKESD